MAPPDVRRALVRRAGPALAAALLLLLIVPPGRPGPMGPTGQTGQTGQTGPGATGAGAGSATATQAAGHPPLMTSHISHRAVRPIAPHASRASAHSLPGGGVFPGGVTQTTGTVQVGSLEREYVEYAPMRPVSPHIPALVVLHGRGVSLRAEVARDDLLPLVDQGKTLLVYPVGYEHSWNAGMCCGPAYAAGVDDLGFVTRVVEQLARDRRVTAVYLAGFSNGGRMAYRVVCADPTLVRAFVVVDAVASDNCRTSLPVSLLQVDGTRDSIVSYDTSVAPRQHGAFAELSATAQVASWVRRDGCSGQVTNRTLGTLQLAAWLHCRNATAVQFLTYEGAGHEWPPGGPATPSASQELWSFVNNVGGIPAQPPAVLGGT